MTLENKIQHTFDGNICIIRIPLPGPGKTLGKADPNAPAEGKDGKHGKDVKDGKARKYCENIRNCDIFVDKHNLLLYADVQLFRFQTERTFNIKNIAKLFVKFNTKDKYFEVKLPCFPAKAPLRIPRSEPISLFEKYTRQFNKPERVTDFKSLRHMTPISKLKIDNHKTLHSFEANFEYGFGGKYRGKFRSSECQISAICRVPKPNKASPLKRTIKREMDELEDFSREEYKLNFVELQVPEGHENPMKYVIDFDDTKLTKLQQYALHNIISSPEDLIFPDVYNPIEIDCGLVSILLSICYDVRCTENDPTCGSAWTRTILSPVLSYFEPFGSIRDVVIAFLRRSLIYPLYRNYDLARLAVEDAIKALQKNPDWIVKQFIITHDLFQYIENSREIFNRFFIDDYIRYMKDGNCSAAHLQMLGRNLKNVLLDVSKKNLRLDLNEIETELLKELVDEMRVEDITEADEAEEADDEYEDSTDEINEANSDVSNEAHNDSNNEADNDANNDENDYDQNADDEGTDGATDTSTDTEENSVIEQHANDIKN